MNQHELREGFYIANLRDENLLCYVHRTKKGTTVAGLSDERELPVSDQAKSGSSYILPSNLKPINPDEHLKKALDTIRFIYTNKGRLQAKTE